MGTGIPFYRPEEVELCYQATCKGDVNEVKKLAQRLFHDPRPLSEPQKPHPAWIFKSLAIAIQERNIEIVRILLEENVADGNFLAPAEIAVRARACEVLELLLQYGWDINQPSRRNEPPLLRYPYFLLSFDFDNANNFPVYLPGIRIEKWLNGCSTMVPTPMPVVRGTSPLCLTPYTWAL